MYTFRDFYQNEIHLSFQDHPYSKEPKHVLVISRYQDKWLLTKHKDRGLEFPGGKVEKGETPLEAAHREVMEETGGIIQQIHYVGQYYVSGKASHVVKNIYFAVMDRLEKQDTYYETDGPVLLDNIPKNVKHNRKFSFIMKDDVLSYCLKELNLR